jgi:hypothetical protein
VILLPRIEPDYEMVPDIEPVRLPQAFVASYLRFQLRYVLAINVLSIEQLCDWLARSFGYCHRWQSQMAKREMSVSSYTECAPIECAQPLPPSQFGGVAKCSRQLATTFLVSVKVCLYRRT